MFASNQPPADQRLRLGALALLTGFSDGQLLGLYIDRRDAAAFEGLVRRHGPMVLGVCRRLLRNHHDAEDAFQATFIVLARKAAEVRPPDQVGNWLYGVAYRTALKARVGAARRRAHERRAARGRPAMDQADFTWDDSGELLHEELARLPTLYRLPVVLCDLEGRPRKEVAGQLGVPEGTLSSRLAAGRQRLAAALTRRGVALSSAGLVALLAKTGRVEATVPPSLVEATVRAVETLAAGGTLSQAVAPHVLELADYSTRLLAPAWMKVKVVGLVLAAAAAAATAGLVLSASGRPGSAGPAGAPRAADEVPGAPPAPGPVEQAGLRQQLEGGRWVLWAINREHRTVTVAEERRFPGRRGGVQIAEPAGLAVESLPVAPDARVELDGRPVGLEELQPGLQVTLGLRPGRLVAGRVTALSAERRDAEAAYELSAVNPARGVISVKDPTTQAVMDDLPLAPDAQVEVRTFTSVNAEAATLRVSARPGKVADLRPGMRVGLVLAVGPDGRAAVRKVVTPE